MAHASPLPTTPTAWRFRRLAPALWCLALGLAAAAPAAPPPGHPTPGQTPEMLLPDPPSSKELRNQGTVVSTLDAGEFTYIEVGRAGAVEWLAAPLVSIRPGSTLRFEDGSLMDNFYSKLLQRTFTRVRFVGAVLVTVEP